ncbi:MAG TPA: hypothetical protein VIM37_00590 [Candidatus Microsaccharimonas sp.]|jgi:hypothetical protein
MPIIAELVIEKRWPLDQIQHGEDFFVDLVTNKDAVPPHELHHDKAHAIRHAMEVHAEQTSS